MDKELVEKVAEKLYYMVYPGGSWDTVEEDVRVHWRFKANKVIPLIAEEIKRELEELIIGIEGCKFEERFDDDKGCIVLDTNMNQWREFWERYGV